MVSAMYAPHQTKGTYSLVPGIPELRDTKVETDAERERTGEDRRDEDTCRSGSAQPWLAFSLRRLTVTPDDGVVERGGQLEEYVS